VNREVYKETVEALEKKTPIRITSQSKSRPVFWRYAAVGLLLVALGLGAKELSDYNKRQQINLTKKETKKYFIVAGAFRVKNNATKKVNQLIAQGYEAELIGTNRYGLHQVSFAGFADKDEALASLRTIKRNETRDAWLLAK